jgi:fumarylpyruvate hydrolase|tara:strand:+ start:88 stop:786 length:699 start_codon:yes stop_codon:yes gene_type:complete
MPTLKFPAPKLQLLPIVGDVDMYPVSRIFCVGRNYLAHAAEMGGEVDREAPWYFTKSAQALCQSDETVPYPAGTSNYHHEMELVVALGKPAFQVERGRAMDTVFGYACGLDMTRRDRQQDGKDARRPWSLGKDVENGAVIGAITPKLDMAPLGPQRIALQVNGETRQDALLSDMVWAVAELISHLSQYYHLNAGDLIMTGTPAGVGPVVSGDAIAGQIDGLAPISHRISEPE